MKKVLADSVQLSYYDWGGSQWLAQREALAKDRATDMILPEPRPLIQLSCSPGNPAVPWVIFLLWPLLGAIHFITLLLLFSSLAHKQCGQFPFTCPGISDSSPAGVALSGYTVECLANKIHKAEIGKSMPLLIMLCHLSCRLREGLPIKPAPETLKGRLPWALGASWPCCLSFSPKGTAASRGAPGRHLQSTYSLPV